MSEKSQNDIEKEAIELVVKSEAWKIIKAKFDKYMNEAMASVNQNGRPLQEIGAIIVAKTEFAAALNEFLKELELTVGPETKSVRSFR